MRFSTSNPLLSLNPSSGDHDLKKLKFNPPGGASSFSFSDRMVLKKNLSNIFVHLFMSKFNLIVALFYLQKSHLKKKRNLESSQPKKASKQTSAVLVRWFLKT